MKNILSIIFLILFISCTGNKKDERIVEFETTLGRLETKILNEIVTDFDKYLKKKYNGKEYKLKEYLTEISESNHPELWKIDSLKIKEILNSNLFAKYDTIYPDSVWYGDGAINVRYSSIDNSHSIIPFESKNQKLNIDSLIYSAKTNPRLVETEPAYFQIALESLKTADILIQSYLDAKQTAGTISVRLIADGLLHNYTPDDEYFAKRILIMEMNK